MKANTLLANRLREVFLNGRWIANTNYKELISNVTSAQAIRKYENLNSIAALTFHVNYYLDGLIKAFDSNKLDIRDKLSFDLPTTFSEEDWYKLKAEFLHNANLFADKVELMDEAKFEQVFIDEKYGTYQRNIEAVIEHSYYHLGQISLLIKLLK